MLSSFKSLAVLGLLGAGAGQTRALANLDARLDSFGAPEHRGEHHESIHSPEYWPKSPRTSIGSWTSEQTTLVPTPTVQYSDATVADTSTTTLCTTLPANTTVIASTFSKVTSSTTTTTTYTTTTSYVQTTITPYPSPPSPNPCPTYCSISAGTVNLFYWPTDEPYKYPTTHFDEHLDYTFTSPSVYMVVDTIYGTNTAGRVGPSGTSVIFPLDLDQVSTIVPNISATQQLTLNDLWTDCPQTEPASVIATKVPGGRCDPILAAPEKVKSWASPCNACGDFGLFDPPYAVSPITGGLLPETTTMAEPEPQTTATIVSATEATSVDNSHDTITSTAPGYTPAETLNPSSRSIVAEIAETTSSELEITAEIVTETSNMPSISTPTPSSDPVAPSSSTVGAGSSSNMTPSIPASATRLSGGMGWTLSMLLAVYFL